MEVFAGSARLSAAVHASGVGSVFGVDVWTPRSAPAPVVKLDLSLAEDVRVLFLLLTYQALAAVHLAPPAAIPNRDGLCFLGPTKSVFVSLEGGVGGIVDISVRLNLLWHVNEVFSAF